MGLVQNFMFWGLASASLFCIAQEDVIRGNQKFPHQIPSWFARMAKPETVFVPELESFIAAVPDDDRWLVKNPVFRGQLYSCQKTVNGEIKWTFCE